MTSVIHLAAEDVLLAREIAAVRLSDPSRHKSAHRPTARNMTSQFRGAAGEIAAVRWWQQQGFGVAREGFRADTAGHSDLTVAGRPLEIMTAKVADRERTGFCVPPLKLAAARRRSAWGYLFVGTGIEAEPTTLTIQAACRLEDVDLDEARETYVSNPQYSVLNYVVRPDVLIAPCAFLVELCRTTRDQVWAEW